MVGEKSLLQEMYELKDKTDDKGTFIESAVRNLYQETSYNDLNNIEVNLSRTK